MRASGDDANQFRQAFSSDEPGRSNQHAAADGKQQQQQGAPDGGYDLLGQELSPYAQRRLAEATGALALCGAAGTRSVVGDLWVLRLKG